MYKERFNLALHVAEEASKLIIANKHPKLESLRHKGIRDLVTEIDTLSETLIIDTIKKNFPHDKILSEEQYNTINKEILLSENLWIIDPLDGTMNFAHNHPHVGVSIAFAVGGHTQFGIVYSPFHNEHFTAVRGGGAFLNNMPIRTSTTSLVQNALIATGFPADRTVSDNMAKQVFQIISHCRDLRRIGAASLDLCWVACGRLDGYYESVKPWDCAAGILIAREASANIGRFSSKIYEPEELIGEELLVASPGIYNEIKKLIDLEFIKKLKI